MIGKIYILEFDNTDKVYIGSTIKSLNRRLTEHHRDKKRYLEGKKKRKCSCIEYLNKNTKIKILEEIEVDNQYDKKLKYLEQEWIDKTLNCMNINKAIGYKDRTEYFKIFRKQYYSVNKEINKKKRQQKRLYTNWLKDFNIV
jgi:hypothetical protein